MSKKSQRIREDYRCIGHSDQRQVGQAMDIRRNGKRLAVGITTAVTLGSLATAGVASAVVYANTTRAKSTGTTAPAGTSSSSSGSTPNNSTRPGKSYSRVSPVQPGTGGTVHGKSSGS
jgi:hypothetical protein